MSTILLALGFAVFVWWFSTGLILLMDRWPRFSFASGLCPATVLAAVAIAALIQTYDELTVINAFIAFTASIILWGWHELAFLSGYLTGSRKTACPENATGWYRFRCATAAVIHHELALAGSVIALAATLAYAANPIGFWVFFILWAMRLSAKFNIFLGVPNATVEFMPARLTYLVSYFRLRRMNALFPVSITLGTAAFLWLSHGAFDPSSTDAVRAGYALLATLTALGVLEHWFMVIPIRDAALWQWYLNARDRGGVKFTQPGRITTQVLVPVTPKKIVDEHP